MNQYLSQLAKVDIKRGGDMEITTMPEPAGGELHKYKEMLEAVKAKAAAPAPKPSSSTAKQ